MELFDITPILPKRVLFWDESRRFAEAVLHTNMDEYRRRNQGNAEKVKMDITIGKYAEFAVYQHLLNEGCSLSEPDCMIYDKKSKSFDADLSCDDGMKYHVKSCRADSTFPISWLFEHRDKLTHEPTSKDMIALCVVSEAKEVRCAIVRALDVVDMYSAPIRKDLYKKVLYLRDFQV